MPLASLTTNDLGYTAGEVRDKIRQYQTRWAQLYSERSSFDAHWQELARNLSPRRTRFVTSDTNKGDRRHKDIIDSTGLFAVRTLKSGLHAGLTSPARPWMKLATPDPDLNEREDVKLWLHTVTGRMLTLFLRSNLYNALPMVYGDMGTFGTAAMSVLQDEKDGMRCQVHPLGSYVVQVNRRGLVSTFIRQYTMTVEQMVEEFGGVAPYLKARKGAGGVDWSVFSTRVKTAWDRGNYDQRVEVAWVVEPNREQEEDSLDAWRSEPHYSCHFELGTQEREQMGTRMLRQSGFSEFPVLCPRWDTTSTEDSYGTECPGMIALGDINALQTMAKRKAQAVAKMVSPPLSGPSSLRTQNPSSLPGHITYTDVRDGMRGLAPIYEVKPDLRDFKEDIQDTRFLIERAFFVDLFLMLARADRFRGAQPITAREVDERHEEKLLALGPVLERTNDELLDPMVDRTYSLLEQLGGVPPPPPELQGSELKVEYISLMAQAQKLVGIVATDRFLGSLVPYVEVFPSIRYKINAQQAVDIYADQLGVEPGLVRPDKEANELEAQDRQAAAAAQQSAQVAQASQAIRNLGQTPTGDGQTALSELQRDIEG